MPRPRNGNNGNGHGDMPPEGPPPENPGDDSMEQPDDQNPQQQAIAFIRGVMRGELDQFMGSINERLDQIVGRIEAMVPILNQHTTVLAAQQSRQEPDIRAQDLAPAHPVEMGAKPGIGGILTQLLAHSDEIAQAIASGVDSVVKMRQASRPPDPLGMAMYLHQNYPQVLNAFVPDALGGRFPDIVTNAVQTGIKIGVAGKGGTTAPLVGASDGLSASPSSPSNTPTQPAAAVSLANLTDDEIIMGIDRLIQIQLSRSAA